MPFTECTKYDIPLLAFLFLGKFFQLYVIAGESNRRSDIRIQKLKVFDIEYNKKFTEQGKLLLLVKNKAATD